MDIFLAIVACLLCLAGVVGCVIPGLPGPPLAYAGLLLTALSRFGECSARCLVVWGVATVAVTAIDYLLPIWITRRLGGSRYAAWGTAAGIVVGLFFLPWGMVLGPFCGALLGELIHDGRDNARAFRVAMGSFLSFALGTGAKLVVSGAISYRIFGDILF